MIVELRHRLHKNDSPGFYNGSELWCAPDDTRRPTYADYNIHGELPVEVEFNAGNIVIFDIDFQSKIIDGINSSKYSCKEELFYHCFRREELKDLTYLTFKFMKKIQDEKDIINYSTLEYNIHDACLVACDNIIDDAGFGKPYRSPTHANYLSVYKWID